MSDELAERSGGQPEEPFAADSPAVVQSAVVPLRTLSLLAAASACLYGTIAWLSWRFEYHVPPTERPIPLVLALFAAAFVVYLGAIRVVWRAPPDGQPLNAQPPDRRLLGLIVWSAVLFRVVLLLSVPIQEIDIYRYVWDGAVSAQGISPFRYSPRQVLEADTNGTPDEPLRRLARLRDERPALAEILRRVHYGELPTIYPPVSQAVFAAAHFTTPATATPQLRLLIMKVWLVGFDLATLLVLLGLLRVCRMRSELCLIYAWCPLLMKEVANSGHLDAIAVFLATWAMLLTAQVVESAKAGGGWQARWRTVLAGLVLGLAVGAKLYPVVLLPLIGLAIARCFGWRWIVPPIAMFTVTTLILIWPMLPQQSVPPAAARQFVAERSQPAAVTRAPIAASTDPSLGLRTFLRRWEMNDFLFLVLVENLKPTAGVPPERVAWFSLLPDELRGKFLSLVARHASVDQREAPFLLARALTGLAFLSLALVLAWRAAAGKSARDLCEAGFLTLAWFWLLCPTQNPWYWTWTLPLLPFARGRAWLAVSGLVFLYYLRFWLGSHWPRPGVLGTPYDGYGFFDFVVTWFEYAPWLLWLALAGWFQGRRQAASGEPRL